MREWCIGPRGSDRSTSLIGVGVAVEILDQSTPVGVPELLSNLGSRQPHDDVKAPRAVVAELDERGSAQSGGGSQLPPPVAVA